MKKFLSLVLALAMTLSLVTISAGAKDFADSDELSGEQYEEAVNVMSEMGIIDGYASGDFQPQGTLTRGAAAKIIACMMLGKTTAEALGTQAAPFKDVPVGSTFAGYIAYCVESGLIDGYADGTFRPQNTLTGFAFLKMLLTALGYDSSIEGYTGTNWTVNVAGRATQIGLTDGNDEFVGTRAATREEACLYAVNALKATLVEYENKGQEITVSDGTVITVRPSAPTYVTSSIAGAATSIDDTIDNTTHDYTVEFAEKYQPDLELDRDIDAFGRPSHTWSWKGYEIGTYVDYDKMVAEYTAKVTGRDLYDAIGRNILNDKDYDFIISVDGETEEEFLDDAYFTAGNLVRTNTNGVGETGNGVLTQVFVDTGAKEVYIAVINTYLAVTGDYDDKDDELDLEVYSIHNEGTTRDVAYVKNTTDSVAGGALNPYTEDFTVSGEDFDIADYVDEDIVLVTVADGEVQTIEDPEILSAVTIGAFRRDHYVEVDGTQYDYADSVTYDPEVLDDYDDSNLKDITYNVILDPYGYMIGVEQNEDPDQYLFLVGMDASASNLSSRVAEANVIFMDGTVETVDINTTRSENANGDDLVNDADAVMNTWCTYTVNSDGVYTLTEVGNAINGEDVAQTHDTIRTEIDRSHVSLSVAGSIAGNPSRVYGNDETVYLVAETDKIDSDSEYVSTGANDPGNNDTDDAAIIDDVASVVVGVENTDIEVMDRDEVIALYTYTDPAEEDINASTTGTDNISHGVYVLYDDESYVIGAVVIGEDAGSTSNFVYVISDDANRESYSSADDEYTWTREVILNGELTEISYVGDTLDEIGGQTRTGGMRQGQWYYVKYYADGTVKEADLVDDLNLATNTVVNRYIVEDTILDAVVEIDDNSEEHVLLENAREQNLTFRNGTLYSRDSQNEGIWVSPNVMVVRIQTVDDVDYDEVEYYEGRDGLEDALDDLYIDANDDVYVSAIVEDGAAVVIILNNFNENYTDEGSQQVDEDIMVDLSDRTDVGVQYIGAYPGDDAILDAIEAQIEAETGYDVTRVAETDTDEWTFTAERGNRTMTFVLQDIDATVRVAQVNYRFSHGDNSWTFAMVSDYVPYAGGNITGTLTAVNGYTGAVNFTSVTVNGANSAALAANMTFSGTAGESETATFTIGACTADVITVTVNGVAPAV